MWTGARRWEPKRLVLRIFSFAGVLVTTARITTVHLSARSPWSDRAAQALTRPWRPPPPPQPRDRPQRP